MEENASKFVGVLKKSKYLDSSGQKTCVNFFPHKNFYNYNFAVLEQKLTRGSTLHTQWGFMYVI